jgi:DNA-binding MarR family transcriptional regulator
MSSDINIARISQKMIAKVRVSKDLLVPAHLERTKKDVALRIAILSNSPVQIGFTIGILSNFFKDPAYGLINTEYGLTDPEIAVIFCLGHRDKLTAVDICNITLRPKNSVSRAVIVLLGKGLIARCVDGKDARRRILTLSTLGKKLYDTVKDIYRANEKKMLSPLTKAEAKKLSALLRKLISAR